MRRFIGQSKFSGDGRRQHIGFELFAREYENGRWSLPTDFNAITATDIRRMPSEALLHLDFTTELISFNLEQRQFIDPDYVEAVALVQSRTPITLITELTERADDTVTLEQLQRGAKRFHDAGLKVCIDDVGTGSNNLDLVTALALTWMNINLLCRTYGRLIIFQKSPRNSTIGIISPKTNTRR
ncbi:EAL domain-containing protein [Lacticaseibacillus manihotivorans]|uniref:EAL domain-containing protein n=1 Tax=Lacticaseibacillus manihotivorans TaxID=88233 RepID=UPI000AD6A92F|nr:EAL domain-containing protein [Lacticaseibacillus manihotivorans]